MLYIHYIHAYIYIQHIHAVGDHDDNCDIADG